MNKKGFTLTELLASITILALISTIAGFTYTKIMKDNKIEQCNQKILFIEKQAIKYASDNPNIFRENKNNLSINDLICEGYLVVNDEKKPNNCVSNKMIIEDEEDVINPLTGNIFNGKISLTKTNGLIDAIYEGDSCE